MKLTFHHDENIRVFSKKTARQIELLKRYYTIDIIKKEVTIPLHYQNATDFIDTHICDKNNPIISNDFLVDLSNIIHSIPKEFNINVNIKIDNYNGYNYQTLLDAIKNAFEIFNYDIALEKNKSGTKVSLLIIFGITVLAWLFFICSHHWIGQSGDPLHDLIHEIIYTIGGVVFWEAIYIVFLPSSEYNSVSFSLLARLKNISLYNKNGRLLETMSKENMKKSWITENVHESRSRKSLLFAGTAILCVVGYDLTNLVELLLRAGSVNYFGILITLDIIALVLYFISGIGAVSFYVGKGPFRRIVPIFGVLLVTFSAAEIGLFIYAMILLHENMISHVVIASMTFIIGIIYIVATAILSKHFKPVQINVLDLKKPDDIRISKKKTTK